MRCLKINPNINGPVVRGKIPSFTDGPRHGPRTVRGNCPLLPHGPRNAPHNAPPRHMPGPIPSPDSLAQTEPSPAPPLPPPPLPAARRTARPAAPRRVAPWPDQAALRPSAPQPDLAPPRPRPWRHPSPRNCRSFAKDCIIMRNSGVQQPWGGHTSAYS